MMKHLPECFLVLSIFPSLFVTGEVVPIRVNGLVNESILLSPSVDSSHSVQQVYWTFQTYIMAAYINNELKIIEDKFEGRLEILDNGRSLRIGELRLEDSGLYAGTITFTDKSKDQKTYNLTVYDYVPVPTIRIAEMKKDGEWCNVTLNCSTSTNTSALSYIWKYKQGSYSTMLHNNTGDTIQISLQPESWDMEIMCIVHNPVDRKNVSVQKICRDYGESDRKAIKDLTCWIKLYIYLPILMFLSLSLPLLCLLNRRKPE
ncbi:SLAM family member 9-like [Lithobates pipiens]